MRMNTSMSGKANRNVRQSSRLAMLALLIGHQTALASAAVRPEGCTTEQLQAMAPPDTAVTFAAREQGACRVSGYINTRDPGPNRVLFMLMLPDNFNGRYLYLGIGGAAGQLPVANPALLSEGYAMGGSDAGTGPRNSADFNFNPGQREDYRGRGVHVSAQATQQIARRYYQREDMQRYISGCSGGGQMGITNASRFGRGDFDGFLVGAAPLPQPLLLLPYDLSILVRLQSNPASWIEPEKLTQLQAAILARYDSLDGVKDGIIADPRDLPEFDFSMLRELGFTPAQVDLFRLIYAPQPFPRTPYATGGKPPSYPLTTVGSWPDFVTGRSRPPWASTATHSATELTQSGAPFHHIMFDSRIRAAYSGLDYETLTRPADLVRYATLDGKESGSSDPSAFDALHQQGGRMIVYHGTKDQALPVGVTTDGYAAMRKHYPDAETWIRAYSIPGMQHCTGGEGPTDVDRPLLAALVAWVESGVAPEGVVAPRATAARGVEREFLICPEPRRPRLRAQGLDPMRAESWECRVVDAPSSK